MLDSIVITYNGSSEKRSDCVFIRGKFFHRERDCFFYDGIYYSPFSRYLVIDNETGERVHLMSNELLFGLVEIKDGEYILGYYSKNVLKNCSVYVPSDLVDNKFRKLKEEISSKGGVGLSTARVDDGGRPSGRGIGRISLFHPPVSVQPEGVFDTPLSTHRGIDIHRVIRCMDYRLLDKFKMESSTNSDLLCLRKDIPLYNETSKLKFESKSAMTPYDFNLAYNSEVMMDTFNAAYELSKFNVTDKMKHLSKYIGNHTFGVEYESWDGRIPTYISAYNGLIPVRDGSLRHDGVCGFEYATVIMSGVKGLAAIQSQCKALREYTVFNENCSLHIHVGNIPRTRENLVKLYKAFLNIQGSLYQLFPSCLKSTKDYKAKDYCSALPSITLTPDKIVEWLSDGTEQFKDFGRNHPKDSTSQSKWHIASRYSIANLNNFYYTSRGTVELRISTPTFNHNKVTALLFIICMIIDAAIEDNKYYTDVSKLIEERMTGEELVWMSKYIEHRRTVLSSWESTEKGVRYYETIKNDAETGSNGELV